MSMSAAYHRAGLAEIGIAREEFAIDPVGAIIRASAVEGFDQWARQRLVSASALRALVDDIRTDEGARRFGQEGHRVFARQLQALG